MKHKKFNTRTNHQRASGLREKNTISGKHDQHKNEKIKTKTKKDKRRRPETKMKTDNYRPTDDDDKM